MNRKKLVVALAGGAAALSLIGVGAGASFTDSASASQSITRGNINLLASTDGVNFAKSVSFTDPGPVNSEAQTIHQTLTLKNFGTLPIYLKNYTITETGPAMGVAATYNGVSYPLATDGSPNGSGNTEILPGASLSVPLTYTLPAAADNTGQNTVSTATLTGNGTDSATG